MKTTNIKILKDIPGYVKNQTVRVSVDKEGTPLARFWRRRFADAKTDNCLEIIETSEKSESTKKIKYKKEQS